MALKKIKQIKGINADYWKIVDCDVKNGIVMLALYYDKDSAKVRDNMLDGRVKFNIEFPIDVVAPLAYAYTKIKESKMENVVIKEAVYGEDGQLLEEEVKELRETNWFFDSEDC